MAKCKAAKTIQAYFEPRIQRDVQAYYDQFYHLKLHNFQVKDVSFKQNDNERFISHPSGKPYAVNV